MKIKRFNQILENNHLTMINTIIQDFDILLYNIEKYLMIEFDITEDSDDSEYVEVRNVDYDDKKNMLYVIFDDEYNGTGQQYDITHLESFIKILNKNGYLKSLNEVLEIIKSYQKILSIIGDYMKFEDKNIGDIFGVTRIYKTTGMEKLLVSYDDEYSYDNEEYVDINNLIEFMKDPELYKNSRKYNI